MLDPGSTRGFERAVAELQQGLFVVKTEERYDPSFSYRWDLVEAWLPDAVREGRRLGPPGRRAPAGGPLPAGAALGLGEAGWPGSSACRRTRSGARWRPWRGPARRATDVPGLPAGLGRSTAPPRSSPAVRDGAARRLPLYRRPHASPPAAALRRDPAVVRRAHRLEPPRPDRAGRGGGGAPGGRGRSLRVLLLRAPPRDVAGPEPAGSGTRRPEFPDGIPLGTVHAGGRGSGARSSTRRAGHGGWRASRSTCRSSASTRTTRGCCRSTSGSSRWTASSSSTWGRGRTPTSSPASRASSACWSGSRVSGRRSATWAPSRRAWPSSSSTDSRISTWTPRWR